MTLALPVLSQDVVQPALQRQTWDVFARRNAENPAQTDLIFVDLLSGEQTALRARGEQFTLTSSGVIYFDQAASQVHLVRADGIVRDHPFINTTSDTHRVDWVVSEAGDQIVWTISQQVADGQFITATWLADIAGVEIRELLVYGPRDGIQLLPIGFGDGQREIYMEAHVAGSEGLSPYTQRAGLFALVVEAEDFHTRALPGDQSCLCAVGFGANLMLRLAPNLEAGGLDVEIYPLDGGDRQVIAALSRGNYRDGGNIIVSADGEQAIYALSQIRNAGEAQVAIRTVLVHVDIGSGRQRIASSPIFDLARPLGFTDEDRAVLFRTRNDEATYKLDLEDGRQFQAAGAVYLGRLSDN
jgi:hypothetical protein